MLRLRPVLRSTLLASVTLAAVTSSQSLLAQARLDARYEATVAGITIGTGQWTVDVSNAHYMAVVSGKTSKWVRYISIGYIAGGQGTGSASGTLMDNRLFSSNYAGTITTPKKNSDVRMAIESGTVKELKLNPPPDQNPQRVFVTTSHRHGVIDPMSAAIMPVLDKSAALSPAACKRSLPVFDGWLRFDLQLAFKRMDQVKTDKGYAGPAVVCAVHFSPVAGYIPSRAAIKYLTTSQGMEIWFAPIAGTNVVVPIRAEMPTPIGHAVLKATQFVAIATVNRASSN